MQQTVSLSTFSGPHPARRRLSVRQPTVGYPRLATLACSCMHRNVRPGTWLPDSGPSLCGPFPALQ